MKKRQLSKLPATLPNYNYESFSYKDIQKAVTYYQNELAKIEKLIGKVTQISKTENVVRNNDIGVYSALGQATNYQPPNQPIMTFPVGTNIKPYQPGIAGDTLDMPLMMGGISLQPETIQQPQVVDNSADLEADIRGMLNQNAN